MSVQKMYGQYGLEHHIMEISRITQIVIWKTLGLEIKSSIH